ncbi:ATP-binding protein [uncultured Parolsenella sp.]|uniref:sensor histidine kinase n=1 Tax=uncultured Parolsenella sp. TaxID=2083008 RepID=UPI0027D97B57|nr:ATP-binding protein [uncultured Parolsenella sp.]
MGKGPKIDEDLEDAEKASRDSDADGRVVKKQPSLVRRIFMSLAIVSTIATVVVMLLSTLIYQASQVDDTGRMLDGQARLIGSMLRGDDGDLMTLANLQLGEVRLTLIDDDGTVLYDSQSNVNDMGNHADRPEVSEAREDGEGSAERDSETTGMISIYRAIRLSDGRILRLSVDREGVSAAISHDMLLVALVAALIVVSCWVVARVVADALMRPILAINPKDPDPESSYREVAPLLQRISDQMEDLKGTDLMRREFTSNVTHELKTPLSSIQGAAELIRDGIAKPKDVPNFAGRIYDEARHMTTLVNDILVLSKLDEAERSQSSDALLGKEGPVNLLRTCSAVADRLRPNAEAAGVGIAVAGDSVTIQGLPRLLDELAYNLSDNAIRYNREGGRVDVWAGLVDGKPTMRVADTGMGIPKAAQRKVFERFYRVDASRARQTGGTGLGLAIVKHAASYHGAEISLESEEGVGTTVTVTFPEDRLLAGA